MTVPPFPSFQSTVNPFIPRDWVWGQKVLVDSQTGAPTGLQNFNGNGANGIWVPIDLTAGQIASPSAAMIADLNANYRLNVAPYTRYRSNGTTLVEVASGDISGNLTVAGTLSVEGASTFSGAVRLDGVMSSAGMLKLQGAARTDPAERTNAMTTTSSIVLTANNNQDSQSILAQLTVFPDGHNLTSGHNAGLWGIGNVGVPSAGGVITTLAGVGSHFFNTAAATVTNGLGFFMRTPGILVGGTTTNIYALYQEPFTDDGTTCTNAYGFTVAFKSGIGTLTPAYGLDEATGLGIRTSSYFVGSVGNALTAVGTNRATALALTKQKNNVGTAASGTGVVLPSAATVGVGGWVDIFSGGANAIQVYGAGSDTIDTVAGSTGVPLTNTKRCRYSVDAAATWTSAQWGVVSA